MSNTTISPNMNLPVPVVSVDPGPDWATNINACLSVIDGHNHTPGSGVQITPAAININADLPINANNVTTARSVRFSPQGSPLSQPSDIGCIYESGVDLYYNDGNANQVRITQSGSVTGSTGTITGLPSGTASAAYSAGVFTFQSATNTPAELNVGSVVIGQEVASGYNVTVNANNSQASNYALTLPAALPASTGIVTTDTSGNLAFSTSLGSNGNPFNILGVLQLSNNTNIMEILGGVGNQFNVNASGGTANATVSGVAGLFLCMNLSQQNEYIFGIYNNVSVINLSSFQFATGTGPGSDNKLAYSGGTFTITNNNSGPQTYQMFALSFHS